MSQKNISTDRSFRKHTLAVGSVIFILLFCLIGIGNYAYSPSLRFPLRDSLVSIEVYDVETGRHVKRLSSLGESAAYSSGSYYVRLNFSLRTNLENQKLYLSAVQAAIRVRENSTLIYELGEFKKGVVPPAQDVLIDLKKSDGGGTNMSVELIPYSLINTPFKFVEISGVDDAKYLNSVIFFKTMLTEYGYLALSGIFLVFSLVYALFWVSMPDRKEIRHLAYACLCQIWTSFYYSRQGYASPLGIYIHHISFIVYFVFAYHYSKFVFSFFNIKNTKLQHVVPMVPLVAIAALLWLYISYSLTEFIPYYKDLLFANLILNYLPVTVIAAINRNKTKYPFMIASGVIIVFLGQANDVLRVFSLSLAPYNIGPYTYFLANMFFIVVLAFVVLDLFEQNISYSKLAAIGETTQTLAHDIRKPFSQLKTLLANLNMFKDNPSQLEAARSDINRGITHVESMLSDIIDFSREVKLETQPESMLSVLDFSIRQSGQNFRSHVIDFRYDIKNKYCPLIDGERCGRVLANIISNAIEAITEMEKRATGTVFISTRDAFIDGLPGVEIVLANDGPPFNEEDIPRLFSSFFTKGKKKGTGLGLASVRKIVDLHGGTINARNLPGGKGVEFILLLPASTIKESHDVAVLPKTTGDILIAEALSGQSFRKQVNGLLSQKGRFEVILLEDETLYRAAVKHVVRQNEDLVKIVSFYDAQTVDDALKLAHDLPITHAIVDIDLNDSRNGFDFLAAIKDKYPLISCMVHSNRCGEEDKKKAKMLGAKVFIPKPLSISHLVEFLSGGSSPQNAGVATEKSKKKVILACDDDALSRRCAEITLKEVAKDAEVHVFASGEELLLKFRELTGSGAAVAYTVYTDQNMGKMTGLALASEIRKLGIQCKIFIVANELKSEFEKPALMAGADGFFEAPLSVEILAATLD